jgi:O-succinylbenzoic acid--CoA ligase
LPHVQITLSEGNFCGQTGAIAIQTGALAWGYYPNLPLPKTLAGFQTDDLGFFDAGKNLHVVGRASNKIISGGENVFPAEVEAAIQSTCLVEDVCVIGLPNPDWGEIVIAVYVPRSTTVTNAMLVSAIAPQLSRYKHPKYWIAMPKLPRNDQGKINREQVRAIAQIIMI